VADPEALVEAAGLDPTARAETLSVDDYLRLAESVP
jgi:16S rRNA A1518/A1519 N6-dimethyltransferase RsmA/KsgA/DIM1 with predicted DNA glycosylase/AP lyase activity